MGTNNIIPKAQRNKALRSFQPVKVQRNFHNELFHAIEAQRNFRNELFHAIEAQRNFRNELFHAIEAQRNSAIAEQRFCTKVKRNLTSAIEISQHNANAALFQFLDSKRVNNLLKKADIYYYYDRNKTKLSSMYRNALLTEKNNCEISATSAIAEVAPCPPLQIEVLCFLFS